MIPLKETGSGVVLIARVKAGSGKFSIASDGDVITIHTKSPAEGNKANQEIVKELSHLFGRDVRIIRGLKSRNKEILVEGAKAGDVERVIS